MAAEEAAKGAMEHGLKMVEVYVKGPGSGREAAIRAAAGCRTLRLILLKISPQFRTMDADRRREEEFN